MFKWSNKETNGIGLTTVFHCFITIAGKKSIFDEHFGKCLFIDCQPYIIHIIYKSAIINGDSD